MEHLIHFFKDLKQTGAIAPSSKFLAKDLVTQLKRKISSNECPSLNILELGPGTGPLTKEIARQLRPQDQLDIVEIHKKFYQIVKSKYRQTNIQTYHTDILEFEADHQYDFIFSSLPYENMPQNISKKIWRKKLELCSPSAYICYFKYVKFRKFKCDFEEKVVEKYSRNKKIVLLNLPPAKIYTLEITNGSADSIRNPSSNIVTGNVA